MMVTNREQKLAYKMRTFTANIDQCLHRQKHRQNIKFHINNLREILRKISDEVSGDDWNSCEIYFPFDMYPHYIYKNKYIQVQFLKPFGWSVLCTYFVRYVPQNTMLLSILSSFSKQKSAGISFPFAMHLDQVETLTKYTLPTHSAEMEYMYVITHSDTNFLNGWIEENKRLSNHDPFKDNERFGDLMIPIKPEYEGKLFGEIPINSGRRIDVYNPKHTHLINEWLVCC